MTFRPLNNWLTIRADPFADHEGSIYFAQRYIEDAARNQDGPLATGIVVAVGKGHTTKRGRIVPCEAHPGDRVLFPKHGLTQTVVSDGEELILMHEQFVYGVVAADYKLGVVRYQSERGIGALSSETIGA